MFKSMSKNLQLKWLCSNLLTYVKNVSIVLVFFALGGLC